MPDVGGRNHPRYDHHVIALLGASREPIDQRAYGFIK